MLSQKRMLPSYSDGWAAIYSHEPSRTSFGAAEDGRRVRERDLVCRAAYRLCSKRDQDYEFAEREGFELSLKICAMRRPGIDPSCRAVIGGTLFDISHIDLTAREMYLYLKEVGKADVEREERDGEDDPGCDQ